MDLSVDLGQLLVSLVTLAVGAGAIYGAIRADLKRLHERTNDISQSVQHAHRRIDDILGTHWLHRRKHDERHTATGD